MIELIRRAAALAPDRQAVVTDDRVVSYRELLLGTEAAAVRLAADSRTRWALLSRDVADVIALLGGAALVGVEMCLYPSRDPVEIAALAAVLDHDALLADTRLDDVDMTVVGIDQFVGPLHGSLDRGQASMPVSEGHPKPHLTLTTGTTGQPRGVRHDWSRLVRSVQRVAPVPGAGDGDRWLLAYGPAQFAALQVMLHALASASTLVAPRAQQPREALRSIRRYKVTHVSATPTFWRFLVAELRGDGGPAPALRQITLGGEATTGELLTTLAQTFSGASVSNVYAGSESGPLGSTRDGRPGLPITVLDRVGHDGVAMKVVDGELWIRTPHGMLGYYGGENLDPDAWQATGDLVDVVGDRIEFRGRAVESFNVGGSRVHPLQIENRIHSVAGVRAARVWGRPNAVTGHIVAVDIVPEAGADPGAVETEIRRSCADLPAPLRPRSIRMVESVPTRGNKIVRRTP